jgi:hypothetical protein
MQPGEHLTPEGNIKAGTYYISKQLKAFNGDKSLALAAYNAGAGNVRKHKGIPPFKETQDYVRKIMSNYNSNAKGSSSSSSDNKLPSSSGITGAFDGSKAKFKLLDNSVHLEGLNPIAKNRLMSMITEYNQITGKVPQINSAFRTYSEQAALYKKYGKGRAAPPGTSRHEKGFAIDVNSVDGNLMDSKGLLKKYGFTRPLLNRAKNPEPWHLEVVEARGGSFGEGSDTKKEQPSTKPVNSVSSVVSKPEIKDSAAKGNDEGNPQEKNNIESGGTVSQASASTTNNVNSVSSFGVPTSNVQASNSMQTSNNNASTASAITSGVSSAINTSNNIQNSLSEIQNSQSGDNSQLLEKIISVLLQISGNTASISSNTSNIKGSGSLEKDNANPNNVNSNLFYNNNSKIDSSKPSDVPRAGVQQALRIARGF